MTDRIEAGALGPKDAVSNWNKVRLRFVPADGEPSANLTTNEDVYGAIPPVKVQNHLRTGLEHAIRPQQPVGQLRGVLKFMNAVEQKSDLNRLEKELCRLFNFRDQSDAASLNPVNSIGHDEVVSLQELYGTLHKWKHVVKLPLSKIIFRSLSRPFKNPIILYDDCRLALDIFALIRSNFVPQDAKENLDQVIWAADLLGQRYDDMIQLRIMGLVQEAIPSSDNQEAFPDRVDTVFLLTSRLMRGFHMMTTVDSDDPDARAFLIDRIRNVSNGISDGQLVHLSFSSVQLPPNVDNKTYRLSRRITFLEGLFAALSSRNVSFKHTVISETASSFFVLPDASTTYNFERALEQLSRCVHHIILTDHSLSQGDEAQQVVHAIIDLCQRITLEIESASLNTPVAHHLALSVFYVLLHTGQLSTPRISNKDALCCQYLGFLRDRGGSSGILSALQFLISSESVEISMQILEKLLRQPDNDLTSTLLDDGLDDFFSALLSAKPSTSIRIRNLLRDMAKDYPITFFRHIMECLWLDDQDQIARNLSIMQLLMHHIEPEEYLFLDVEMLVSAVTAASNSPTNMTHDRVNLGQVAVTLEIIRHLQIVREKWQANRQPLNQQRIDFHRKLETMEFRISVFLNAKELKRSTPLLMRKLILHIFWEIRRITRSVRRPPWLSRVTDWILMFDKQSPAALQHALDCTEFREKMTIMYGRVVVATSDLTKTARDRERQLSTLGGHYVHTAICILTMVSSTLSDNDLKLLVDCIWDLFPLDGIVGAYKPLGFLLATTADRLPEAVQAALLADTYSVYVTKRAFAIEGLATFFGIRAEVQTQEYLAYDKKLPFRNQVPIIPFVPTDLGSPEDTQFRLKNQVTISDTTVLPVEIRRQLMNLGWDETDSGTLVDVQREILTVRSLPMSYFSGPVLDKGSSELDFKHSKKQKHLRRRPIFIPVFGMGNLGMIDLLNDAHGGLYNLTSEVAYYYLREDPAAFLRVFMAELRTKTQDQNEALTRLRLLVSKGASFPPAFAYTLLNDILGFIKWRAREVKGIPVDILYQSLPLLADLVGMVPDMALRDLRKNKVDMFLIPGSTSRAELVSDGSLDQDDCAFKLICVQISQNLLLQNLMATYPKEATSFKKVLLESESANHIQHRTKRDLVSLSGKVNQINAFEVLNARSWINVVHGLFYATPRGFNDRTQMSGFLRQIDVIVGNHGQDASIVVQVLRLYIMLGSKFRRLFNTNRGFSLVIPTMFKIYCSLDRTMNRLSNATIFVWHQLFTAYGDAFIFQAISSLALLITKEESTASEYSIALFEWLQALGDLPKQCLADAASYSIEPIESSSDNLDKSASSRNVTDAEISVNRSSRHSLADTLRLFFTVIAYDPSSLRAEQFVQIITLLLPHLMKIPVVEGIVGDGILALLRIFAQWPRYTKNSSNAVEETRAVEPLNLDGSKVLLNDRAGVGFQEAYGKHWQQNDKFTIRQDFVLLLAVYADHGGRDLGQSHRQVAVIVRQMLRDLATSKVHSRTSFIGRYVTSCITPKQRSSAEAEKQMNYFLDQIAPSVHQCGRNVDFTDMNNAIAVFVKSTNGRLDSDLVSTICHGIISPEIAALCCKHEDDEAAAIIFGSSIVDICLGMFMHCGMDVVSIFSKQLMSPRFLTYLVVPFCHELLVTSSNTEQPSFTNSDVDRWMILLAWLLSSCQQAALSFQSHHSVSRSTVGRKQSKKGMRDEDDRGMTMNTVRGTVTALTFALNLTAVKVVLIKGEEHFQSNIGLWSDIANIFRSFRLSEHKQSGATQGHAAHIFEFASQRANVFLLSSRIPAALSFNSSRTPLSMSTEYDRDTENEARTAVPIRLTTAHRKVRHWKDVGHRAGSPTSSDTETLQPPRPRSQLSFEHITPKIPTSSAFQEVPRTVNGVLKSLQHEFNYLCSLNELFLIGDGISFTATMSSSMRSERAQPPDRQQDDSLHYISYLLDIR